MNNAPTYWVACSGGVDSIVLLHLMLETKNKNEVGILHCNFHLREQSSNEDELFVRNLARELNVPIRVQDFDTKQYAKSHRLNTQDRKSTRLNSSHVRISYAVFCLKKK